MYAKKLAILAFCLLGSLTIAAHAQLAPEPPTEQEALEIISTHDHIKANLYKIILITPGKKQEKDGFIHDNIIRVTALAPRTAGRPSKTLRQYLLEHTEEYGWFIATAKNDARGIYLEISSQKKGKVFLR